MSKTHFKSNPLLEQQSLNVDRENGIIKNVCIAQHGENKNYSYFNDQFLTDLVSQGNEQKQGVKSRFGHPNMCATTLGTFIGRYKDFSLKDRKVYANLHLDNISKKTQVEGKGISMYEYITDMAETNSDMFGNSIVVMCDYTEEKDDKGDVIHDYSLILESFLASDLVDDPAATDQLFSNTDDLGIIITDFLDENPQIFNVIQKTPSIIEDFFERYIDYTNKFKNNNEKMSFLKTLKKTFGVKETFDIEETTATGEIVTVITEDENPKVGDKVNNADGSAVTDGDLTIKDGSIWVIEGGAISEIKEPEGEDPDGEEEVEPSNAEVMQSINNLGEMFKNSQNQYKKDLKETQDSIQFVASTFETKFNNLAKTVKSSSPDYEADPSKKDKDKFSSGYDPEKVKEAREARETSNKQ